MRNVFTFFLLLCISQVNFAQLSGPLNGTLGPGNFHVVDTISVEQGDSLRLMPGTNFVFDGYYPFRILGVLTAIGTANDTIVFTTDTIANPNRWRGIYFYGPNSSGSRLEYCVIKNGIVPRTEDGYRCGGAVYCEQSSPIFTNCSFRSNYAYQGGGAIFCLTASPTFTDCEISRNTTDSHGGGVYSITGSSPTFTNCIIYNNSANSRGGGAMFAASSPTFTNCIISDNSTAGQGGGIDCSDTTSLLVFTSCVFSNNSAARGGGISCSEGSSPSFSHCLWKGNISVHGGGGASCFESYPIFSNCTFVGNTAQDRGGGVRCQVSSPTFTSTIIAFSEGAGIYFDRSSDSHVQYCDVFGNSGGGFSFFDSDPSNGPADIGQVSMTNHNGDLCDRYYNILLDPMFVDTSAGDLHLMAGSPCIDAGDPDLPDDPDGTIADIGAFYNHQVDAESPAALLPIAYALHPNYPNPFNPMTTIRYDVKQTGVVRLTVYDLLGREVVTLANARHVAGSYTVTWNAVDLPSGVYFCRMEAPDFVQTRKMVLLK